MYFLQKTLSSRRLPSGYIVFAGEIRKSIQIEHPESSFGDISRIVGMKVFIFFMLCLSSLLFVTILLKCF